MYQKCEININCSIRVSDCSMRVFLSFQSFLGLHCFNVVSTQFQHCSTLKTYKIAPIIIRLFQLSYSIMLFSTQLLFQKLFQHIDSSLVRSFPQRGQNNTGRNHIFSLLELRIRLEPSTQVIQYVTPTEFVIYHCFKSCVQIFYTCTAYIIVAIYCIVYSFQH